MPGIKEKMSKNKINGKDHIGDQSMGILNMDDVKAFGESSRGSSESGTSKVSDRLNLERFKAFKTLQKSTKPNFFPRPNDVSNKENSKILNKSPVLNHTGYASFRRASSINISDLITDETIYLENSSEAPTTSNLKVSFEPAEITARSTHFSMEQLKNNKKPETIKDSASLSVSEILAGSFAEKARKLSIAASGSTLSSSRSLPRTADMSLSKDSHSDVSFGADVAANAFSFEGNSNAGGSDFSNGDFAPAELMQSKMLTDEIEWAKQYAAIPVATLSKEAMAEAKRLSIMPSNPFDSLTNSMFLSDPNFSAGNFFNMRSESLWNIVQGMSPDKCRSPVALIDSDLLTTTTPTSESVLNISITPKIDNKTYSKVDKEGNIVNLDCKNDKHESKDSGNSSETSYLLSMSAIDRALCNLDIQTDDSDSKVINKLMVQAKQLKKARQDQQEHDETLHAAVMLDMSASFNQHVDVLTENKENLNPLADTLSFTESLLETSDVKVVEQSIGQPRSPLGPLDNVIPVIKITDNFDREADNKEWPSTPIKSPHRRERYSKSPKDTLNRNAEVVSSPETVNVAVTNRSRNTKSHCSTRLDEKNLDVPSDFGISPNLSKSNLSAKQASGSNTPSITSSRSASPTKFDHSPMSSPRSCVSSHASSPSGGFRSPHLDSTTSSDRRYLNAASQVRNTNSSPVNSEFCSKFGSIRQTRSNDSKDSIKYPPVRCASHCSSTSEFSHRDKRILPVKVTAKELSWSSCRLRKDVSKSLQVKNILDKRLVLRVEVHGPGFQMINTQGNKITLQPQECRTIVINFCPTMNGIAIGSLSFYPPEAQMGEPYFDIPLSGYGGQAKIVPLGIMRGTVGPAFLAMGNFRELNGPLNKSFQLQNNGSLLAFATISINAVVGLSISHAFEIRPKSVLIAPGNTVKVRVSFKPNREDLKKISKKIKPVLCLAEMTILLGDEGNRQRMRRLVARMTHDERSKLPIILNNLWNEIPNEVDMSELEAFKESPQIVHDLLCSVKIVEVSLTINNEYFDETHDGSSHNFAEDDETVVFCTVVSPSPTPQQMLQPVDEQLEGTLVPCVTEERAASFQREGSWSVRPNILRFDFCAKSRRKRVSMFVKNSFKSRLYIMVTCNCKDIFRFSPSEGYIEPDGGQMEIEVISRHENVPSGLRKNDVFIKVSMENESITIPVDIPEDNFA